LKIIFSVLLFGILLNANDYGKKIKLEILKNICMGIHSKQNIKIWSDDKAIIDAFAGDLNTTKKLCDANLIILNKKTNLSGDISNKYIFVLDYNMLKELPNSFGACFWKKGRPNIVFIKPRLKKQSLKLSSKLKPYIEEKIW